VRRTRTTSVAVRFLAFPNVARSVELGQKCVQERGEVSIVIDGNPSPPPPNPINPVKSYEGANLLQAVKILDFVMTAMARVFWKILELKPQPTPRTS
jgi:hypothetical protein